VDPGLDLAPVSIPEVRTTVPGASAGNRDLPARLCAVDPGSLMRHPGRATGALVLALALTGCATATPGSEASPAAQAPSGSPSTGSPTAGAGFPLTVTNCGVEVTIPAAPERVVAIKSSTTELALALGLADRLVGAAFLDGPIEESLAEAGSQVPIISEQVPSAEAVLELEPDLVLAGWESNLTAEGAGERSTLAGLGIASYVPPAACRESGPPPRMSFELLFEHVLEAGDVLGVPEAASELAASQRARLEAVEPDARGLSALWYSSGTQTPYVGAGTGVPQMILEAAGLENVLAEVEDSWASVSWEEIVARDPDVIVLVDSAWNSAEKKKGVLAEHPATRELTAVREGRYLEVPFPASEAGVRNVAAVESLVAQLSEIAID